MRLARLAGLKPEPHETLVHHVHSHLDVFVNGKHVTVPAGIGINTHDPGIHHGPMPDRSIAYGGAACKHDCISPLHTHADYGLLHTESPTPVPNKLGEFFVEWGVRLDRTCVGGYCKPDSILVYVDGKRFTGDPRTIVLVDRTEIAIVIGSLPKHIPSRVPNVPQLDSRGVLERRRGAHRLAQGTSGAPLVSRRAGCELIMVAQVASALRPRREKKRSPRPTNAAGGRADGRHEDQPLDRRSQRRRRVGPAGCRLQPGHGCADRRRRLRLGRGGRPGRAVGQGGVPGLAGGVAGEAGGDLLPHPRARARAAGGGRDDPHPRAREGALRRARRGDARARGDRVLLRDPDAAEERVLASRRRRGSTSTRSASRWGSSPASRRSTSPRWCPCGCGRRRSRAGTRSCSSPPRRIRPRRCGRPSC